MTASLVETRSECLHRLRLRTAAELECDCGEHGASRIRSGVRKVTELGGSKWVISST